MSIAEDGTADVGPMVFRSASAPETEALGRRFASALLPGDRVLLRGGLGAGKTTFVRGLVQGLGGPAEEVASPTYALHHRYPHGRADVDHLDLYRLPPSARLDAEGLEDVVRATDSVLVVEWPERLGAAIVGPSFDVVFVELGEESREVSIRPSSDSVRARLVEALR